MEKEKVPSPLDLSVEETSNRAVMSCYALDLEVTETPSRAVMSCYALDLPDEPAK
ncbi:MAG: hypothetical protein ACJ74H_05840 [Thermoanaerobaculia bacterium]